MMFDFCGYRPCPVCGDIADEGEILYIGICSDCCYKCDNLLSQADLSDKDKAFLEQCQELKKRALNFNFDEVKGEKQS